MQCEFVQMRVTMGDKEDVECIRDCSVISEKLLDTSIPGLEFFLSQKSLLVTYVHGGCWVFLNALDQQSLPPNGMCQAVSGLTWITSLHPHSHLDREVILSALFAYWESEAQRGSTACLRSHRAKNVMTLGFEPRST